MTTTEPRYYTAAWRDNGQDCQSDPCTYAEACTLADARGGCVLAWY